MDRSSSLVTGVAAFLVLGFCDSNADTSTPAPAPALETAATTPSLGALQSVKSFYQALQNGEVEKALPMVIASSSARGGASGEELKSFSQTLRTRWSEIGVHESQERGPCALVAVSMKFHNGKEFESRLREEILLRKDGAWRIVPEALRSDPEVKGVLEEHARPLFDAFRKRLPSLREKYK
jgi:hypothetical protein